jgi:hypothetical protein
MIGGISWMSFRTAKDKIAIIGLADKPATQSNQACKIDNPRMLHHHEFERNDHRLTFKTLFVHNKQQRLLHHAIQAAFFLIRSSLIPILLNNSRSKGQKYE